MVQPVLFVTMVLLLAPLKNTLFVTVVQQVAAKDAVLEVQGIEALAPVVVKVVVLDRPALARRGTRDKEQQHRR
jgi:hypothetical protein